MSATHAPRLFILVFILKSYEKLLFSGRPRGYEERPCATTYLSIPTPFPTAYHEPFFLILIPQPHSTPLHSTPFPPLNGLYCISDSFDIDINQHFVLYTRISLVLHNRACAHYGAGECLPCFVCFSIACFFHIPAVIKNHLIDDTKLA